MTFAALADGPTTLTGSGYASLADGSSTFFAGSYAAVSDGLSALFPGAYPALSDEPASHLPSGYTALADDPANFMLPGVARLLRQATAAAHAQVVSEPGDIVHVGRIQSITEIDAKLWNDNFVTTITIGGGAGQNRVTIGKAGALSGTRFAAGPLVTDAGIESTLALLFEAVGAFDLTIRSLGTDFLFNDAANLGLDTDYLPRTSIVGALNQLRVLPRPRVGNLYTNGAGSTLLAGEAVRVTSNLAVARAGAAADDDVAKFVGVMERSTAIGLQGRVIVEGPISCLFPAGMGAGDLSKSAVYMSGSPGLLTLIPPVGTGQVVLEVGWVINSAGYVTGTGGLMLVMLSRGPKRVLP